MIYCTINKHFTFANIKAYSEEIQQGNVILGWLDTYIKQSAYIELKLISLYQDKEGRVHIDYTITPRKKINTEYMFRHLALSDVNLN